MPGLLERVAGWLGFKREDKVHTIKRSWDASYTTRLNESRWARASDQEINHYLLSQLKTLRMRSRFVAKNDPHVSSAVKTLKIGVNGRRGPTLQIQSSSKRYAVLGEGVWRDWWASPDVNGVLSGPEYLDQWVGYLADSGEFLAQIVADRQAVGPVKSRLLGLDPVRLESNRGTQVLDDGSHIILGVTRTKTGRPTSYSIREFAGGLPQPMRWVDVPATDIIHEFVRDYAGQVRGVPWLAAILDSNGELHDFDDATLRAARAAAEHTVLLEATGPDVDFVEVDSEIEIEPSMIATLPPGYQAKHIKPEHPSQQYVQYRHERLREVGLAFSMPLMMLLLDSNGHNYSSARFDAQLFQRCNWKIRDWLERRVLNRLADIVLEEARIAGVFGGMPAPRDVRYRWHWEPVPHVDPKKEADAAAVRIATGISTLTRECAAIGLDYESDILDVLVREREARKARGLDPVASEVEGDEPDDEGSLPDGATDNDDDSGGDDDSGDDGRGVIRALKEIASHG